VGREKMKLGKTARDTISGYEGVITALAEYMNGCLRVCITPKGLTSEGKPWEGEYFDSRQVEIVGSFTDITNSTNGEGPMGDPPVEPPPRRIREDKKPDRNWKIPRKE
jgi:hypothetical protein